MNTVQNNNINFQANIKLTPYTKKMILNTSAENQKRFFNAQKNLGLLDSCDEFLLSRKKTLEGKVIPVLTNLTTGAMVAQLNSRINKYTDSAINLIEAAANKGENFTKKLYSSNPFVISESIKRVLSNTNELSIHPIAQQLLEHSYLDEESQIMMQHLDHKFNNKEYIFTLSEQEKLFIKSYDEGYIYYICDNKNKPTGKYFTVTYSDKGFILNYKKELLSKEKAIKYFKRYTKKVIEK